MRKLTALALAAAALTLPAATAQAKGIESAKVCGASGCKTLEDESRILPLMTDTGPPAKPPAPGPSYTVRFTTVDGPPGSEPVNRDSWTAVYAPSEGKLRSNDEANQPVWFQLPPAQAKAFAQVTAGVEPFPQKAPAGSSGRSSPDQGPPLLVWLGLAAAARERGGRSRALAPLARRRRAQFLTGRRASPAAVRGSPAQEPFVGGLMPASACF